jgi:hypothetical protein
MLGVKMTQSLLFAQPRMAEAHTAIGPIRKVIHSVCASEDRSSLWKVQQSYHEVTISARAESLIKSTRLVDAG